MDCEAQRYPFKKEIWDLAQTIAIGVAELNQEQQRIKTLLINVIRLLMEDKKYSDEVIEAIIKENCGDPEQIFKENVLGIKED